MSLDWRKNGTLARQAAGAMGLVLCLLLVSCTDAPAEEPSATPSTDTPSAPTSTPTEEPPTMPSPTTTPAEEPSATPFPTAVPTTSPFTRSFPPTASQDPYLVGAYWYPWYSPSRHWKEGYLAMPLLGEYDMTDPAVIDRHIDWATGHGIDFFAASWWGQNSFEDKVLRTHLPAASLAGEIQFAILYESTGLLTLKNGTIDIDSPQNQDRLLADFQYLAENYMTRDNYLRIDGRPVVFLYLTRIYRGDLAQVLNQCREVVQAAGAGNPFLIGDEVYWHSPSQARITSFDGVTAYNMHTSVPDVDKDFAENVLRQYRWWQRTTSRTETILVPDVLPGFDDTAVRPEAKHPAIPRSLDLFEAQVRGALELADEQVPMVMITSWNEWHEHTQIEPGEGYGFDYLDRLQAALESAPE